MGSWSWVALIRHCLPNTTSTGYEWSDGTPVTFVGWNNGEPSDHKDEDCVEMPIADDYRWNDLVCAVKRPYICEKPKGLFSHYDYCSPYFLHIEIIQQSAQ